MKNRSTVGKLREQLQNDTENVRQYEDMEVGQ